MSNTTTIVTYNIDHDRKVVMLVSTRNFVFIMYFQFYLKKKKKKIEAILTSIGLSWNTSNAKYKGSKMEVVGGFFGPWSYVQWLSS